MIFYLRLYREFYFTGPRKFEEEMCKMCYTRMDIRNYVDVSV
jgi:hypothetical protein